MRLVVDSREQTPFTFAGYDCEVQAGAVHLLIKPKWMRWPTFDGIAHEVRELENAGLLAVMSCFPSLRGMAW